MTARKTLMVLLLLAGCVGPSPGPLPEGTPGGNPLVQTEHTKEEARAIALEYVTTAPTFSWDGMMETLEPGDIKEGSCPSCYNVIITFDSRHGGYGDRDGLMVIQVITPHTAEVLVRDGAVTSCVLDGIWDEMGQEQVTSQTPQPQVAIAEGA